MRQAWDELPLSTAPLVTSLRMRRRGRNRECTCLGHENVRVVDDVGCEEIHKENKMQSKVFIHFPRVKGAKHGEMHQQ